MTNNNSSSRRFRFLDAFPDPLSVKIIPKWENNTNTAQATLLSPLKYNSHKYGEIIVPTGFETDFASVPHFARWYIDVVDPDILYPAIVHDWLYQNKGKINESLILSRKESDKVIKEAMHTVGAHNLKINIAYGAVRLGGWVAWNT